MSENPEPEADLLPSESESSKLQHLHAGAPAYLDDDTLLGHVASNDDINDLHDDQRIVVVRLVSQRLDNGETVTINARLPILVDNATGVRLLERMEKGEREVAVAIPALDGSARFTHEPGKLQLLEPEHVEVARREYQRWQRLGLDRLPEGCQPGDLAYAEQGTPDEIVIGHVANPDELEHPPADTQIIRLLTDEEGIEIPLLLEGEPAREASRRADAAGRPTITVRVLSRSGRQIRVTEQRLGFARTDRDAQGHADMDDLGEAIEQLLDANTALEQRQQASAVLDDFSARREADPSWRPGPAEMDALIRVLESVPSKESQETAMKARAVKQLMELGDRMSNEAEFARRARELQEALTWSERQIAEQQGSSSDRLEMLRARRAMLDRLSDRLKQGQRLEVSDMDEFIHALESEPEHWHDAATLKRARELRAELATGQRREAHVESAMERSGLNAALHEPLAFPLRGPEQVRVTEEGVRFVPPRATGEEPLYNLFQIADGHDTVATHCWLCEQSLAPQRSDRADLLWSVEGKNAKPATGQAAPSKLRVGQMHDQCATRFVAMSHAEQWRLLGQRMQENQPGGTSSQELHFGFLKTAPPSGVLSVGSPVYSESGEQIGEVAAEGESTSPDHFVGPMRIGDATVPVRINREQAELIGTYAMRTRPDGRRIMGAAAVQRVAQLGDLEPEDGGIELVNARHCDFCHATHPRWVYPATSFDMPVPQGASRSYHSEGNWAACNTCSKLLERSDYAGLVRRYVARRQAEVDPEMRQTLAYWHTRLLEQFRKHRTGPRQEIEGGDDFEALTDQPWTRAIQFEHSQPQTDLSAAEAICDFCSGAPVVWRYPAASFSYPLRLTDGSSKPWKSEGDWASCAGCSRAIERQDWDELLKRHMRQRDEAFAEVKDKLRPAQYQQLYSYLKNTARTCFEHFNAARTGERQPVFPESDMHLPTSSPLAQIAFGEQLKLLRWCTSAEGRRYVREWFDEVDNAFARAGGKMTEAQLNATLNVPIVPLRYGETYYWSSEICRMIAGAAEVLGTETPWTLLREAIPATSGFFYCEAPVGTSADAPLRAITWTLAHGPDGAEAADFDPKTPLSIDPHGRGSPETALGIALTFYSYESRARRLFPSGFQFWGFGNDHVKAATLRGRLTIEEVNVDRVAVFATMLAFIQQSIIVPSRPFTPDRATRKQAERERPEREPRLRVIELRRVKRVGYEAPEEHKIVPWKYQWRVRGFWRKQWYPSIGIHQPKFIHPFWKGPVGAPISPKVSITIVDR